MRVFFISCLVLLSTTKIFAQSCVSAPDEILTPGSLCETPDSYRYSEHIAYCNRDVSYSKKWFIIESYMNQFPALKITPENRQEYKIDHYIPLCMGGSNEVTNLWPQHESLYHYTDEIELNLCTELQADIITQHEAVALMKFAKNHLEQLKASLAPMQYLKDNYLK